MMPSVVLVHGYSETSLAAYQHLPELLNQSGYDTVVLSAFDSLDDFVTIDDLALAFEMRVADLEATGFSTQSAAFVCHSTGALIARRWILNRRAAAATPPQAVLPARLITMAGANHGSSLAEIGKTPIGYLQKLLSKHVLAVGKQVLTDLDYGSDFLWRLNDEWMSAWNDATHPLSAQVLVFSLGGDFIGNDLAMKLFWATSEAGSDNTVRISGANLNYTFLDANPDADPPTIVPRVLARAVPHKILKGYSHFDTDTGILHATDATDSAFAALTQALQTPAAEYDALSQTWATDNASWATGNDANVNSTVVFSLRDQVGRPIGDCMICFWDEADIPGDPRDVTLAPTRPAAADYGPPAAETPAEEATREAVINASLSSSDTIISNSPIHNDVAIGSYSFYLNYPTWIGPNGTRHHAIYIEAVSDSQYIEYKPTIYRPSVDINRLIAPNQFTYVNVTLNRDPDNEYAVYKWAPALDPAARAAAVWRPFPALPYEVPPRKGAGS
jgi:alpha-beta hydrolase superfamily lysophospholipase